MKWYTSLVVRLGRFLRLWQTMNKKTIIKSCRLTLVQTGENRGKKERWMLSFSSASGSTAFSSKSPFDESVTDITAGSSIICLLYLLQWVPRWAVPSGSASPRRCPPRGRSPASWRTCLGRWWASAWDCWFSAATRRVCRNSAPGGSSSSPSLLSFFSPSSGTYLLMSCWGCRYHLPPDEGPLRSPYKSSPSFTLIQTKVPLWPQVI